MREYYQIEGYWKDDKSEFTDYIVTNYDDVEEDGVYGEDDIFFFGLEEQDLINSSEGDALEFVITKYVKIIQ